ncbi:hypothetical protein AWB64_01291 [Caballeronia sordidicola]|uniref:DUF4935 domain-containing protein n=1 Tax=Caballeronia sordidicola TaxID=196367 RepID=A0A158FGC4_CABSO|nr:hypothetical protein [Caballeronia sordidicola]SAL18751.1 hypothetical protein AWB64_01291 [Caballeronia sordidicola]
MMAFDAAYIDSTVASGVPVLCADTCSILDIMRDPTRDSVRPTDVEAALRLIDAMEGERTRGLVAHQVTLELNDHLGHVADEAARAMDAFVGRATRIGAIAQAFGTGTGIDISYLSGHAERARDAVDRWMGASTVIPQAQEVPGLAWSRMSQLRTPAQKGKDSMKDCVVTETYLAAVRQLREAGVVARIVFLSSNIKDYTGKEASGNLNADIEAEFQALDIQYAKSASHAGYLLTL